MNAQPKQMAAVSRPGILHVCGRFLPLSETFTYDVIHGLDRFRHHVVANTREHVDVFPWPSVHTPDAELDVLPIVRPLGIDAVLCHFGPQCTRGVPLAAMLGVPVATIFHGYDISRLLRDRRWVERYRACFAVGMRALCISDAGRRKLLDVGCPAPLIDVVHLGVDTRRFTFTPPSRRRAAGRPIRLLTVARLVPKKGIHVAIAAAARLQERGLSFDWRIIGDGPEGDALRESAATLGLDQVRWDGPQPRDVVERAFAWADVYVQPSVTAESGDEEGIPVSLMEAMAAGVPVVSTRHSGIPELVADGRTGLLTDEGDAAALGEAITTVSADPDLAERVAVDARQWVETEFDQYRQLDRTARWIDRTLLSRPPETTARYASRRSRRGVLIQTIDPGLLARKLTLIAHRHPDVAFDVLAVDPSAEALRSLPCVSSVRPLSGPDAAVPTPRPAYEIGIVPFSDDTGLQEQWAMARLAEAGATRLLGLTLHDRQIACDEVPQ